MRRWIGVFLIVFGPAAFAKRAVVKKHVKYECRSSELSAQDCHLFDGSYDLQLLAKTVAWTDGTWHLVDAIPLIGAGVQWEKVRFSFYGPRAILQFWIWDSGVGETHVQSLHWYVAELKNPKMKILAEGVVRKRHPKDASPKPMYFYDAWVPHYLHILKSGELEWSVGHETKKLVAGKANNGV